MSQQKFYLSTIDRNKLTETEKLIVNEMTSYMKGPDPAYTREEGLHLPHLVDDFRDNTGQLPGDTNRDNEYGFSDKDITRFCNKFGIDTNWKTNQILKI